MNWGSTPHGCTNDKTTAPAVVLSFSLKAFAQDLDSSDSAGAGKDVEEVLDKEEVKQEKKVHAKAESKDAVKEVQTLSDLATLAPYTDVAVIQRRFLPKSGRAELTAGAFSNLNNPFFNSIGVGLRAAYYVRERYALEVMGALATTSSRQVTDDLAKGVNKISTDNVVTSKGFAVAAFKWNPIYGKITWLNRTIVPFDLNFNLGGGVTFLENNNTAPTVHLGTSQVFALSKGMAFRWDLIWNYYQANVTDATTQQKSTLDQNDLFLGVGMSFYFPEAKYR